MPAPRVAVLFIDLDDFKAVNDTLGHASGDELLRAVARRLIENARAPSTVSRLAGDEFAILLEECAPEDAVDIAHQLTAAISAPITFDGRTLNISASVGVSVPGDAAQSPEDLLRDADIAMYAAKRRAPGSVTLFESGLHAAALERSSLEIDLRGAAERGEFVLMFQPIVELRSGRTSGHEALVRWQHPTRGLLSPDQFIPLAEATGAIIELDVWVLAHACLAARDAIGTNGEQTIAVNVSPAHLDHGGLIQHVEAALAASGLPPRLLTVEITEGLLAQDPESARSTLAALRALGVRLAGHRRLRHGLLVPLTAASVSARHLEDRPLVRG